MGRSAGLETWTAKDRVGRLILDMGHDDPFARGCTSLVSRKEAPVLPGPYELTRLASA